MIDFPSPILSVSPEVVKDLDGEDALYGMWTVFTKCKQSLKDGRRLENISWRLWYREMSLAHSQDSVSCGSMSPSLSDGRCPSPITPISEDGPQEAFYTSSDSSRDSLLPIPEGPSRHSWHGGGLPPPTSNVRRLSTASMPAHPSARPQNSQRVGSIIVDMLPVTVVMPAPVPRRSTGRKASVPLSNPSTAKPSPVQVSTASTFINSSVPQLTLSSSMAQPRPVLGLPSMQLPSPSPTGLAAPRVVVVNPTPHPTPPATPHPRSNNFKSSSAACLTSPSPASAAESPSPAPLLPSATTSKPTVPAVANQETSTTSHVQAVDVAPARGSNDETLKPSDRRFFLESSESPDRDSPERPSPESHKPSDIPEPSPSSTTSSHVKSDGAAPVAPRRNLSKPAMRRGKEATRFAANKANSRAQVQRQATQRKVTEPKKAAFNIGSASSNGTKADGRGQQVQKAPAPLKNQAVPKPRPPSPPKASAVPPAGKKGLVMSTSSEYTTDSDEDSEWASEDNNSTDEKEKERQQRESKKLREAAEEAQRQRDMFAKVPKRSYSNLNRTKSGLLSQLLNPDPTIFPPNHPYRQSFSTQDMTQLGRQGGRLPAPNYQTSKSSAAVPLATQITPMTAQAPPTSGSSAYRPKGRPHGQEMETDTEEETPENGVQLSRSLAQQKLAALAGPNRRRASDQAPAPSVRVPERQPSHPSPIPLNHPYNLPAPAAPMTPRATRRQMLSTELSESLRRNLLWERQVSKVNMLGGARRNGLLSQRLQPLTAANAQQDQPLDEREERRRAAMARNRSWAADDYHTSGW